MLHYSWICHACHATNPAGAEACASCGCPALASVADINETKTGIERPPRLSRKEFKALRRAEIAALPFWKKPVAYVLQAQRLAGGVFFLYGILGLSLHSGLTGFGIVLLAEVLFSLLKGAPYIWEDN